jgi:hypothetical protein
VLGGTDVNEYSKDPKKREIMEKCLDGAFRIVSFTNILSEATLKVRTLFEII